MSDHLQPHGLQHVRLPCPSLSPRVCSNSYPLSWWFYPTISSSVIPFSCLQSFLASWSFLMSQLFASDGQSIGVSASASVLPVNIHDWFPLGWTGWITKVHPGCCTFCELGTNAWRHVSISYHHTERLHCPTHTPWTSPPGPGNHWSFYCLCTSAFSRMS